MPENSKAPRYKYKIWHNLAQMTKEESRLFWLVVKKELGITRRTVYNWANTAGDSKFNIPEDKLKALAGLFNLSRPEDLKTNPYGDEKKIVSIKDRLTHSPTML